MSNKKIFLILLVSLAGKAVIAQNGSAIAIVKRVADKVIKDTKFELTMVPFEESLGMQVLDFRYLLSENDKVAYSFCKVSSAKDTLLKFGLSSGGKMSIWINKKEVFTQKTGDPSNPVEIAYGRFVFDTAFSALFRKGENEIIIRLEKGEGVPVIFLRPITETMDLDQTLNWDDSHSAWMIAAFPSVQNNVQEQPLQNYYEINGEYIIWKYPARPLLTELVIPSDATYKRDSYADWNYSNGATLWSIMQIGEEKYIRHARKYADFILKHSPFLKWQYDSLYAYRGSFHRIFRRSMLDDSGTPALPLAELYLHQKDAALAEFIKPIAKYVYEEQVRLEDRTFCRPEPVNYTVWADDLFMSVPFLVLMARSTGEQKYYDDAARQVIQFRKYLLDPKTGLYKHGWFSKTRQQSVASWGRANGWVMWATAELLNWLPTTHPEYKTILQIFRDHISQVVRYQESNGMWRQILDRKDSYEETSCTALMTLAIARGVRRGWLSPGFKENALKGWKALEAKIDEDGTVHGICRGTEIGVDEQFYMDRPVIDNDPRGLGAVIIAGLEISKLN